MAKATEIPDCGSLSAAEGALLVLRTRLDEMLSFRDAALDWSNPEGIHDMRVASRRLRSIAKSFGRYLPKSQAKKIRRSVRNLADALGAVRDEDVALAALEKSAQAAPPELVAAFESVAAHKRARRKRARVQLFGALEAETFAQFREEIVACLAPRAASESEAEGPDEERSESAADGADEERSGAGEGVEDQSDGSRQSFREAGREIIERHLHELVELSANLFRPHDSEGLHELRIAAKELRYALELFSACWTGRLKPFAKEIAHLQSSLGDLHDCDAWIKGLGKRLAAEGEGGEAGGSLDQRAAPGVERRAALWLFRHFASERASHHEQALARWHAWENYGLLPHLRELLRQPREDVATESAQQMEDEFVSSPQDHAAGHGPATETQTAEG